MICALAAPGARAAGIDCTKARSPTEKAICADPHLLALDQQVAGAYADALARDPSRRDAMRQELIGWLKQRDTKCALPAAEITQCLGTQLGARLAALALAPAPATASAPVPPAAPGPATPAPAASGPLTTAAAPARPADPAIPAATAPPGAATLEPASLPAAAHAEAMVHVTAAGRFTIAAHSPSGAALQLVDIMTGPGEVAGSAGTQDGRIDALLDTGTYKLRVSSAAVATGAVALSITPFHDAAPAAAAPPAGFPRATTLRDGEQLGFWLAVPPDGGVRIEAAGRSLADLRLWRDGRDLAALEPDALRVEPAPGHPLSDLRLVGKLEPGTYLAVAYGGPALPWTDNDSTQPLLLRTGASPALAEGWAGGKMGPFGSEVYALPASIGLLRLTLPAPAAAELRAGDTAAAIDRTSREPTARLAVDPKQMPVVELRAAAGQDFVLQALEQPAARRVDRPGTYWVSAVVNGAGGDEVPPGVLLEMTEPAGKPARIVASTLPQVGPSAAWHTRFNLRGPTTLLLQNTAGGALAVRTTGVPVTQRAQPGGEQLPADYYDLSLTPVDGALGSLDLVVGPPGATTPALSPLPRDPVIPLGIQAVAPGEALLLHGPAAPGLQLGLSARRVPVALAEGPLTVTQLPGSAVAVPVALAAGGTLAVSEVGGGPVAYGTQGATVVVPISDHARTLVLAWRRTPATLPIPAPAPAGSATPVAAGTPAPFDLARDETRGFALAVPEGGLYRVETLGRLHTAGRIATAFIPRLGQAEANGAGQNMLLQAILRAGRYRVEVTAKESAGHLALAATPAPILTGGTLVPGGSVRASLPAGTAVAFPLQASGPGEQYRLEVASLGAPWQGRIEDAQGWPLTRPGALDGTTPVLPEGAYRLVVAPDVVARQVVARLSRVIPAVEIAGHGPHELPFEAPQAAVWREPGARDDPRTPDAWRFGLAGPAEVTLRLGDGMTGTLHREGEAAVLASVTGSYTGTLEAGRYRVEAMSLGRNDRLAYTIGLTSTALQPGVKRMVTLPGSVSFAVAEARVASLTSYGNVPVKAVLRGADGTVIARVGARADDWNIAASRRLPAGRYTLDLAAASPPDLSAVVQDQPVPDADPTPPAAESGDDDKPMDHKAADDQEAQSAPSRPDAPEDAAASPDAPDAPTTELLLALPETLPDAPAPGVATALAGRGVHGLDLPAAPPGSLVVAQAASSAAVVLALEHRDGAGWRAVGQDQGTVATVAASGAPGAWRVAAWTVDGGDEPIRVAARIVTAAPARDAALAALDGMPAGLAVAHVALESAAPVSVDAGTGVRAGGWAGQMLADPHGAAFPEGPDLWLMGPAAGAASVKPLALGPPVAMTLPPGQVARLPAIAAERGHLAFWRAEAGFGQPGLGAAAGVAAGSVIARSDAPATLRNAAAEGGLRLTLARVDGTLLPGRTLDAPLHATLPPGAALPVALPPGMKAVQLDLGPGVAAFANGVAAWSGGAALSRTLAGDWTEVVLVNAGTSPAPASVAWQAMPGVAKLQDGGVVKRFFGAAGSFERAFEAPAGATLSVAGGTLTVIAADGAVLRGTSVPVSGAGRVVVAHEAGPVALWLAADGASPWPAVSAQPVQAPASLALAGPAMALALNQPGLLHVSTTAPVIASLVLAGRAEVPLLFGAGAELHAVLAGPAELRLFSPSDGPLTGSLTLGIEPLTPVGEGLGAPVTVAPGGMAAFSFDLAKPATIGVGVRADPDVARIRLLNAAGAVQGEGAALLRALPAGRYVIEAQIPPGAPPVTLRPAVIGITPRGAGPPPEIVQNYLELAGLKPASGTAP